MIKGYLCCLCFVNMFSKLLTRKFGRINEFRAKFSSLVTLETIPSQNGSLGVIGLNSQKNRNALSVQLVQELNSALSNIENDSEIRVLIIRTLVHGIFCAGADLKERAHMSERQVFDYVSTLRKLTKRIYDVEIPVIAALDGIALGGGLELALACDLRTASSDVKLGLVETKLAVIPGAGGTQYLPRLINPSIAKELIYTAKVLNANEAKDFGIINHVIDQNETHDAAYQKSIEIANNISINGPLAVKMAKKAINAGLEGTLEAGLLAEEASYARLIPTEDRMEGLNAFKDKRSPRYIGE